MIRYNVQIKNWLNVGGPVDVFFKPNNITELINFLQDNKQQINIIGVGSNILIDDTGIRGVTIRLGRGFTKLSCQNNIITAGAATLDYNLARYALEHGVSGFEFFIGIPGTIGGALAMNAGCYGSDTASILQSAKLIDDQGNVIELSADEIGYVYRGNTLPKSWIFIEAKFIGSKGSKSTIKKRMIEITQHREKTQPIKSKTCGSIFKNPPNRKAWQLIDQAGCRGLSLGDVAISDLHCNFLINRGNATAWQIAKLCKNVRERVKLVTGVDLQWEMIHLGN